MKCHLHENIRFLSSSSNAMFSLPRTGHVSSQQWHGNESVPNAGSRALTFKSQLIRTTSFLRLHRKCFNADPGLPAPWSNCDIFKRLMINTSCLVLSLLRWTILQVSTQCLHSFGSYFTLFTLNCFTLLTFSDVQASFHWHVGFIPTSPAFSLPSTTFLPSGLSFSKN